MSNIEIYTDGSCHTQQCIGAWGALILADEKKIVLFGSETKTTHNRMELMAAIRALENVRKNYKNISSVTVVSDSQYVVGLNDRKEKLLRQNFITGSGKEIRNADLVKSFFSLCSKVRFIKIKAHQKKNSTVNYNIEVDLLVRKIMRDLVV